MSSRRTSRVAGPRRGPRAAVMALVALASIAAAERRPDAKSGTTATDAPTMAKDGSEADAIRDAIVRPALRRAEVRGPITPATVDYLRGAIETARAAGAPALVVELDTPGGLLESTKSIVQDLLAAPVPVIVYVSPGGASATSAGVFLTMAAHVAAMAPGTSIGAAHPVGGRGETIEGDMRTKVENYAAAFGSAIAERRGRNVEWAEKAVRESLTATENDAVARRVVDFVAADVGEVLKKAGGREVDVAGSRRTLRFDDVLSDGAPRIVDVEMTLRQKVVAFVANPNVAYLLMMGAMIGLYIELSNPGLVLPGVAGAICLLLALLAAQILPISSTGALLLAIGMAFLIAELFFPSFGALGIGGIIALALGSLFLYTPESALSVDRRLIAGIVSSLAAFVALVFGLLLRDRRRPVTAGSEGMEGQVGEALGDLTPKGQIKVRGEIWTAVSDRNVSAGEPVRIVRVRGLVADVTPHDGDRP